MTFPSKIVSVSLISCYDDRNMVGSGDRSSCVGKGHGLMLRKFKDQDTERFANGEHVRRLQGVPRQRGYVALDRLDAATRLYDLRNPPGNRFEALRGDRQGQYSIRINDQWRVCFEWSDEHGEAFNIEITDYH